jgi:hypothetical protein
MLAASSVLIAKYKWLGAAMGGFLLAVAMEAASGDLRAQDLALRSTTFVVILVGVVLLITGGRVLRTWVSDR